MKWLFIRLAIIMSLLIPILRVLADERTPITPENLDRLTELASTGRGEIEKLLWTPDSQSLIAVDDAGFYFYDADDLNKPPYFIEDRSGRLQTYMDFVQSPNGELIMATSPYSSEFGVWKFRADTQEFAVNLRTTNQSDLVGVEPYGIWLVAFSPDTSNVVLATANGSLFRWSTKSTENVALPILDNVDRQSPSLVQMAFNPDGTRLVSCHSDGTIQIWNTDAWELLASLSVPNVTAWYGDKCLEISPDGSQLLTRFNRKDTDSFDGIAVVSLWTLSDGELLTTREIPTQSVIAFDNSGAAIAVTAERQGESWIHLIRLVELSSETIRWEVEGLEFFGGTIAPSHERLVLFSCGGDGCNIFILSLADGHEVLEEFVTYNMSSSLSPDGTRLAVAGHTFGDIQGWGRENTPIRMWDLDTGLLLTQNYDHATYVVEFAFSPDSRNLALSKWEAHIVLWDTATWELRDFGGYSRDIVMTMPRLTGQNLKFTADGEQLAVDTISSNGTEVVIYWDVPTGTISSVDEISHKIHSPDQSLFAEIQRAITYSFGIR